MEAYYDIMWLPLDLFLTFRDRILMIGLLKLDWKQLTDHPKKLQMTAIKSTQEPQTPPPPLPYNLPHQNYIPLP